MKNQQSLAPRLPRGCMPNLNHGARSIVEVTLLDDCLCPFCLMINKFPKFRISKPKKCSPRGVHLVYDKRLARCPDCGTLLLWRTLRFMDSVDAVKFADWVFPYRLSSFWQKINFKKWNQRLSELGWSEDFWKRYHELRGDIDERTLHSEEETWRNYNES